MDYIVFAIPVFILLIAIEIIVTIVRKKDYYRFSDAINSLSAGMISITSGILTKIVSVTIYAGLFSVFALWDMSVESLWVWVFGFLFYDLCYYWTHRMGHEINVLWAAHAVHHQSEEYNLTTALRQTSSGFIFGWLFYVPMAVVGIPPVVFFTVGLINLLYQFWVHTRHVPKLGWFEWFFVTPSNHRVHHGKNRRYLDKNYGGVFILWDRLFGTFEEEDEQYEPIRYGTLKPLRSWNPLWANLQLYVELWQDCRATRSWKDKLTLWFRKTGYRPSDVATPMKMPDIHAYENYKPAVAHSLMFYAAFHFALMIVATLALMSSYHLMPMWFNTLWVVVFAVQLLVIGWLLEKSKKLVILEAGRFAAVAAALGVTHLQLDVSASLWWLLCVLVVISLLVLSRIQYSESAQVHLQKPREV
ncbi:sterol desaturase family protein [Endozoicomonas gorgoniicola]|uniref:Sterol desaturase family protein n=1 Tax=Endozoicomonas gorgoniicola TaxID=1234144 RepID=A0ABT3MQ98_9GAMM|nr:sterol desaturase family protein [Endozoicomonas gorgoniicola]MCW7551536.1 sterol desaturase family protein [Endozoicomonas gorgoniicola]